VLLATVEVLLGSEWGNRALMVGGRAGVPFTAQFEERQTEMRADGTQVVMRQSGRLFVDRAGRTRLEMTIPAEIKVGEPAPDLSPPSFAMLYDASGSTVAGIDLVTNELTWEKTSLPLEGSQPATAMGPPGPGDLGTRLIDGVTCDGFRFQSADLEAESWVSRKTWRVVLETKKTQSTVVSYRMFDIVLQDPDPKLFAVLEQSP